MNQHPFFQSIRTIIFYFCTWILIMGIHFSMLFFLYGQSLLPSLVDSIFFNGLYSILGLALWYTVRYSIPSKPNLQAILVSQVPFLVIIVLLWFGLGYTSMRSFFSYDKSYINILEESIPWRIISGTFIYVMLTLVYYLFIYYNNLQEKIKAEGRLNEMVKESELNLLKSQINPHFLFNSLNSISSLTVTNPDRAREMTIKLSDFLRYSVSQGSDKFTMLPSEIENIKKYLDIEKVRFGSKLVYDFDITEACSKTLIPVMILQPLYENAVKHGVYESTGEILIKTKCYNDDCCTLIEISNNFEPGAPSRKGAGIGLRNIRDRLKLIYRNDQLLKTTIKENVFQVILIIPDSVNPSSL